MEKHFKSLTKTKKVLYIILPLLLVILLLSSFIMYSINYSKNATVFTIDDERVSKAEFVNMMSDCRAEVFQYFVDNYDASDSSDFWSTSFNGEVPNELLKQKALEKLKKIKVEQIVLKKYKIIQDTSYNGFLKDFKAENKRRSKALEEKEPIYGPKQYKERAYYSILQGNRVEKLKNKLETTELAPNEDEITEFYNTNKESIFKNKNSGRLSDVLEKNSSVGETSKETSSGYKSLDEVREQIKNELVTIKYDEMISNLISNANCDIAQNQILY